jgi:hypothetical protein
MSAREFDSARPRESGPKVKELDARLRGHERRQAFSLRVILSENRFPLFGITR